MHEGANVEAILHKNPGVTTYSVDYKILYDGVDRPLRVNEKGAVAYYELDVVGNVRRLRGAGGEDLGGYRYTAFGKLLPADSGTPEPTIEQPLRWQGRLYTSMAGGMYDVRAREWSPELAVFLSADEFQFLTTRGTLWSWPLQNAVRWRDPSGRFGVRGGVGGDWMYWVVGGQAGVGIFIDLNPWSHEITAGVYLQQGMMLGGGLYLGAGKEVAGFRSVDDLAGVSIGAGGGCEGAPEVSMGAAVPLSGTPPYVGTPRWGSDILAVSTGPGKGAWAGATIVWTHILGAKWNWSTGGISGVRSSGTP